MAVGGGIDIKLNKIFVLRACQIDYYLTRYEALPVTLPPGATQSARNQNNFRFAAGMAFNFGAR